MHEIYECCKAMAKRKWAGARPDWRIGHRQSCDAAVLSCGMQKGTRDSELPCAGLEVQGTANCVDVQPGIEFPANTCIHRS
jgi:hypothetical protein